MRHLGMARRAGVLAAVTAAVVLSAAAPAAADVTVNPSSAVQGSGENLYFSVPNEGSTSVKEVTLRIPVDTPIAEVYPLSVNDWAPKIEWRDLNTAIQPIHGASPVTKVPSAITWLSVGKKLEPGQSTELAIAAGPLPLLSTMKFTVDVTYADGTKAAEEAVALALTPGTGVGGHHTTATGDTQLTPAEEAAFNKIMDDADAGPSFAAISGWVVAALALLGAGFVMWRNRHRATEEEPGDTPAEPTESEDEDKEPVSAGTSKWAFKG
ncbi:DUF1775 domain-containing protein [Actinoplanes sp. NPDC051861]|uniref:DUF1775 domain-containing protein n=1 Tax=Actinoplanes sp. NPDC051861 TaxID=3155170 RepID=UPI00341DECC7